MKKYYYDLHIHSCLSPCGDDDMTPNNIAGMGVVAKLDIMALTDHNTCLNCPAFFKTAEANGIVPVAGMELTTAEDIHLVCLFEELSDALKFSEEVNTRRIPFKNRVDIFGQQMIMDENDEVIGVDDFLLSNASKTSFKIYPVEVKSSKNYTTTSLNDFKDIFSRRIAQSFIIHPKSYMQEGNITKVPPYMFFCLFS